MINSVNLTRDLSEMNENEQFLPSYLFLQLGAEQQISEEEDVPQLPGSLHQLHHETVPQKLAVLWKQQQTTAVGQQHKAFGVDNSVFGNYVIKEAFYQAIGVSIRLDDGISTDI